MLNATPNTLKAPDSNAAMVQRLRRHWCVRINDLNTYNPLECDEKNGRVLSPSRIPNHWRGKWGTDEGYTFICLESGDLFVLDGEPSSELLGLFKEICPRGNGLRVPYFAQEALHARELLARVKDPYCKFGS